MDGNHYPNYARPQNGNTYRITHHNDQGQQQDIILTNQHVVPYNPHLTMLLGCHVNVEFCANLLGSIKYIHKYISKGPDHATISISADGAADEIRHYEDCRYIGPHEAIWRILHFSMHGMTPNVYRLQLHLKGEHYVYFNPEGGLQAAVQQGRNVRTMLEAFYIVSWSILAENSLVAMLIMTCPRQMPHTQRQRRFYIRISLSSLSGKPMRSAGHHKGKGMQLGGFITVAQELGIGSIYAFFLSMSRGLLQRMTYALSMAINMGHAGRLA